MKPLFLWIAFFCLNFGYSQKFGYINSEHILSKMSDYAKATKELEQFAANWQKEVEGKQKEAAALRSSFVAERVLLTSEMKQKRETEIVEKENELQEFQKKIFGVDGLYFLKKTELVKPLQDKIFDAVEKVAKSHRLVIVFDKADQLVMVYTDPRHDYTDFVLEELGLGDPVDKIK